MGIYIRRGRDPRTGGGWGGGGVQKIIQKKFKGALSCLDDLPLPQEHPQNLKRFLVFNYSQKNDLANSLLLNALKPTI